MSFFARKKSTTPPRRRAIDEAAGGRTNERERQAVTFRRGSTRAGSTSHTLRNAQAHALSAATPREKLHHLAGLRRRLSVVFGALVVVVLLLSILLWQFTANVQTVLAGDIRAGLEQQEYTEAIQQYLSQNPLERLRFNLDSEALTHFVATQHPEVDSVKQLGYSALATTEFYVTLRKPVVSWQVQDTLYYVDAQGVSFSRNIFAAPSVTIVDNSGVEYTSGTAIASARFLSFVGRVVALAQEGGVDVQQVLIPAGTSRQVELIIEGRGYPIVMSIDRAAAEQAEDMIHAVRFFTEQGRAPKYIDLRTGGKAFFRE